MTDYGRRDDDATTQLRVIRDAPRRPQQPPAFPEPYADPRADPRGDPFVVPPAPATPAPRGLRMPLIVSGLIGLVLVLGAVGYALYDGTPQAKPSTIGASSAPAPAAAPIPTSKAQSKYVASMIRIDQYFGLDPVRTTKQGKAICAELQTGPTRAEALAFAQKHLTSNDFQLSEAQLVKAIGNGRTYLCPSAPIAR